MHWCYCYGASGGLHGFVVRPLQEGGSPVRAARDATPRRPLPQGNRMLLIVLLLFGIDCGGYNRSRREAFCCEPGEDPPLVLARSSAEFSH